MCQIYNILMKIKPSQAIKIKINVNFPNNINIYGINVIIEYIIS